MQRDLRVTPKWLIDPRTSKRMGYWDFTTVMALLFTALVTPFEVAFLEPVTPPEALGPRRTQTAPALSSAPMRRGPSFAVTTFGAAMDAAGLGR